MHSGNLWSEWQKFPRHGKVSAAPLHGRIVLWLILQKVSTTQVSRTRGGVGTYIRDVYWSGGAGPLHGLRFFPRERGAAWTVLSSVRPFVRPSVRPSRNHG